MRTRPNPFPNLRIFVALCCAISLGACDKLSGEETKDEEKSDEAGDKKEDGGSKDVEEGKPPIDPKDAEIQALKAEIAASKEAQEAAAALDPEAAKELGEGISEEDDVAKEGKLAEGEKGPVSVAKVSLTDKDLFGDRGKMFEISAEVTLNESKDGGVYAKASCVSGDEVFANVSTISTKHAELGEMKPGDTKRLDALLFTVGLEKLPERCQISFDYGASDFSTRIADVCWDGKTIIDGICEEPVVAKAKGNGKVVPFGFKVKSREPLGRDVEGRSLNVRYATRFNEQIENAPHLHLKTSCKVADKTWVEVAPDFPHVKPFTFANGEATLINQTQFFSNPLPAEPEDCNMTVLLDGGFNKPDTKLGEVCFKGGSVSDGQCAGRQGSSGSPEPITAESLTFDEFEATWGPDWRDKTKHVLNVKFAATAAKRVAERNGIIGTAKCGNKKDEEHRIGPDLSFVDPGESVAVRMVAFRGAPLDKPAKNCELTFTGGSFFGDKKVDIGKACLRGDKLKAGGCRGGGGGKKKETKETKDTKRTRPVDTKRRKK